MIIIQSNDEKTMPHHFDCASALFGAYDSAQKYRLTSFDEIQSGKMQNLLPINLAVGSVEFMHEVFNQLNVQIPKLPRNSNRYSETLTLSDALERASNGEKIFIKPVQKKLFTGFVLDKSIYSCLNGIPENTLLLGYKPFESDIKTEWRVYVYRGKIYDIRNYSGDFTMMPSIEYIESIIKENTDFPCAYTADIGVLDSGENVVVEFNDMYAIGNYGLRNDIYLFLLRQRYFDIINTRLKCPY